MNVENPQSRRLFPVVSVVTIALVSAVTIVLFATGCGGDEPETTKAGGGGASAGSTKPAGQAPRSLGDTGLGELLARFDGVARPDINVLLISLDSVRADFLSTYGHQPKYAPNEKTCSNIDDIAAEGVVFEDYKSNTSWTLPSHMSMMSGEPELIHGVELDPFALDPSRPTIATVLQKVGYKTAGFFTGPYCHERFGFSRGMDVYEDAYTGELYDTNVKRTKRQQELDQAVNEGRNSEADELIRRIKQLDRRIDTLSHRDVNSKVVCEKAMKAIDLAEAEGKPWFVFAHYFDPHYDYIPPKEYEKRFDPDYKGKIDGHNFFKNPEVGVGTGDPRLTLRKQTCSERDLEHILALYEAEIAYTDYEIGRMLDQLRQKGILDKTLVIITADHGEEFFEHGGIGHRSTLLEEQLDVPMIMRLPGVIPAGQRIKGLASHPDILPTILDYLGLPSLPVTGNSMKPLVDGADDGSDRWVLGRLVQVHPLKNVNGPKIVRNTVKEVFYQGDLKLYRWRRWWWPEEDCPEPRATRCRNNAAEQRASDHLLRWIDLSVKPNEMDEDFVEEFDDSRAAAALAKFQSVYAKLKSQPRPVGPSVGGQAFWTVWQNAKFYRDMVEPTRRDYDVPPPGK